MTAILNALRWDLVVQARNGFYWASVFLVVVFAVLLQTVPDTVRANAATPLPVTSLPPIVVVASLSAPILALVLAVAAPNKVAGFAVVKVLNAVNLLPIAAYFVPRPVQYAAGVFPTYWPMRALWSAAVGEASSTYLVLGGAVSI